MKTRLFIAFALLFLTVATHASRFVKASDQNISFTGRVLHNNDGSVSFDWTGVYMQVAFTGRVVCIGYAKQDVSFTTKLFVQKELDIRGSRNAQPEDFEGVIRYLEKKGGVREIDNLVEGTIPWDILISNEVTPEHAEEAMQQWMAAPAKVFRILVKFID